MAGIAFCVVFVIGAGAAVSTLLHTGRPMPRHTFILDIVTKLAELVNDREDDRYRRMAAAA